MHTPAIAVVIPAFNAGRFLNEAIDSVRAQTITQWECLIVDDGSTDDTPSRLAAYRDSRIRSVRQNNSGECAARARGISLTRAPKIVCLDADDRLYPDTLARYMSFLDNHSAVGVAYGERTLINEEGHSLGFGWKALLNKHPQGDVLESILRRPFLSTPSQACLRREAVPPREWLGDRAPMGDWLLLAGAALTHKFAYVGRAPMVEYRVWRSGFMRSLARDSQSTVSIREFNEGLHHLFSFPGIGSRFGAAKLAELRREAEASCFAIKGQEFLRCHGPFAARRYFSAAIRAGSRDSRDLLCWATTFSPALLRWTGPLYGAIDPHG
jgi:glycosyltransferase involved in cell wall biosynthesis